MVHFRVLEYARKCHADRVLYTQTWAEQAGYWGKEKFYLQIYRENYYIQVIMLFMQLRKR